MSQSYRQPQPQPQLANQLRLGQSVCLFSWHGGRTFLFEKLNYNLMPQTHLHTLTNRLGHINLAAATQLADAKTNQSRHPKLTAKPGSQASQPAS